MFDHLLQIKFFADIYQSNLFSFFDLYRHFDHGETQTETIYFIELVHADKTKTIFIKMKKKEEWLINLMWKCIGIFSDSLNDENGVVMDQEPEQHVHNRSFLKLSLLIIVNHHVSMEDLNYPLKILSKSISIYQWNIQLELQIQPVGHRA